MNDNVKTVFKLLGVEPNERFKIKVGNNITEGFYFLDETLAIYNVKNIMGFNDDVDKTKQGILRLLLTGMYQIVKVSKKIKMRDLDKITYKNWMLRFCDLGFDSSPAKCSTCPFNSLPCNPISTDCWINHKYLLSNEFLDQEIEVI